MAKELARSVSTSVPEAAVKSNAITQLECRELSVVTQGRGTTHAVQVLRSVQKKESP